MSLRKDMEKDAEDYGINKSGGMFQFDKSGNFKLRLLTKPEAMATHFFGKGKPSSVCYGMHKGCPFHGDNHDSASVKYIGYVIDRNDGKVKLGEIPWSVISRVADFEEDEDFKFESYPMPYDIKIKVDKENKDPKSIYKTDVSPQRSEITDTERDEFMKVMEKITPSQFIVKRKEKQLAKHMEDGTWRREADARKARIVAGSKEVNVEVPEIEYPENQGEPTI